MSRPAVVEHGPLLPHPGGWEERDYGSTSEATFQSSPIFSSLTDPPSGCSLALAVLPATATRVTLLRGTSLAYDEVNGGKHCPVSCFKRRAYSAVASEQNAASSLVRTASKYWAMTLRIAASSDTAVVSVADPEPPQAFAVAARSTDAQTATANLMGLLLNRSTSSCDIAR